MGGVIKTAGLASAGSAPIPDAKSAKRQRILQAAKLLRAAQSDEDAADALEAAIELSRED